MLNKEASNNINTHSFYIKKALELAKNSGNDVPIAAIIVHNGSIIAESVNLKEFYNDPTAHAEIIAIRKASQVLNNWRLNDCSIYITLEPCPMCASAIIYSRISKVIFSAYDNLYGAFGSVLRINDILNLNHPEVIGGLEEDSGRKLLCEYFSNLRN